MTVHPVRMSGTMIAAPQTYRYFDKLQESIVRFVAAHSQIRAETFRELMLRTDEMANDVGSVLYGEDADGSPRRTQYRKAFRYDTCRPIAAY